MQHLDNDISTNILPIMVTVYSCTLLELTVTSMGAVPMYKAKYIKYWEHEPLYSNQGLSSLSMQDGTNIHITPEWKFPSSSFSSSLLLPKKEKQEFYACNKTGDEGMQ